MMKVVNLSRVGLKTLVPPVPTCEKPHNTLNYTGLHQKKWDKSGTS